MPRPVSTPAPAPTRGCYPDEPRLAGPGPLTSWAPESECANGGPSPQCHVRHSRTRRRPRGSRARPAPSSRPQGWEGPRTPGGGGSPVHRSPASHPGRQTRALHFAAPRSQPLLVGAVTTDTVSAYMIRHLTLSPGVLLSSSPLEMRNCGSHRPRPHGQATARSTPGDRTLQRLSGPARCAGNQDQPAQNFVPSAQARLPGRPPGARAAGALPACPACRGAGSE